MRKVTPNLILKSAAVLHSSFDTSVMSVLLNFVLISVRRLSGMQKDMSAYLSIGVCGSLDTTVIGPTYPYFRGVRNKHNRYREEPLRTSRKLMIEWKVPLPPPTMTTPAFPDVKPASGLPGALGRRDMFGFETRSSSAVTYIFPFETLVLKECIAAGAGASSMSPVRTLKHAKIARYVLSAL